MRNLIAEPDYAATLGELQGALAEQLAATGYTPQLATPEPATASSAL